MAAQHQAIPSEPMEMGDSASNHAKDSQQFIDDLAGSRALASQRERIKVFLRTICESPSIAAAVRASKITQRTHYDWLRDVPGYPEAFQKAWRIGWDSFESACVERAQNGSQREVYQGGRLVGYQRVECDNLALGILKANVKKYQDAAPTAGGISIHLAVGITAGQQAAPPPLVQAIEVQALPVAEPDAEMDLALLPGAQPGK